MPDQGISNRRIEGATVFDPSVTATTSIVFAGLFVAHQLADHWVQTSHQAACKGLPGWPGRWACAKHVAGYVATATATVAVLAAVLDLPITMTGVAAGQAISGITHYWADRRTTLAWLARVTGSATFHRLGAPRAVRGFVDDPTDATGTTRLPVRVHLVDEHGHPAAEETSHDNPSLGGGSYALDQSFHYLFLLVAAVVTALG